MPINKQNIANQIESLINSTSSLEPEEAKKQFKDGLADIIDEAIKSVTVTCTIPAGAVSVGTSPAVIPLPLPLNISGNLS